MEAGGPQQCNTHVPHTALSLLRRIICDTRLTPRTSILPAGTHTHTHEAAKSHTTGLPSTCFDPGVNTSSSIAHSPTQTCTNAQRHSHKRVVPAWRPVPRAPARERHRQWRETLPGASTTPPPGTARPRHIDSCRTGRVAVPRQSRTRSHWWHRATPAPPQPCCHWCHCRQPRKMRLSRIGSRVKQALHTAATMEREGGEKEESERRIHRR